MAELPSIPEPGPVSSYISDGVRIVAILLVWGVIAAFFTYVVSDIGSTGGLLESLGPQIGEVIALAGLLNTLLYILYRAIDYWHQFS